MVTKDTEVVEAADTAVAVVVAMVDMAEEAGVVDMADPVAEVAVEVLLG